MTDHLTDTNVGNIEYIRRQGAIDAFNRIKNTLKNPKTAHYDTMMFYEIEDVLEDVEPADVLPYSIDPDGTLTITVPKGTKVGRVLVQEDGTQWGGLFYAD